MAFIVPLGSKPNECHDSITPNDIHSDLSCAFSGSFVTYGGFGAVMWGPLSLNLFCDNSNISSFLTLFVTAPPNLLASETWTKILSRRFDCGLGYSGYIISISAHFDWYVVSIRDDLPHKPQQQCEDILGASSCLCWSLLGLAVCDTSLLHPRLHPVSSKPRGNVSNLVELTIISWQC